MVSKTVVRLILAFVLCVMILVAGCGSPSKKPAMSEDQLDHAMAEHAEMEHATEAMDEPVHEEEEATEHATAEVQSVQAAVEPEQPDVVESEGPKPSAELVLKFKPEDSTTYKLTTESEKSVLWEGPDGSKPSNFGGGHTGSDVGLTFEQRVESVNEQGNAIIQITIKSLKYTARVKDNVVLDFDSAKDKDNPLSAMIGQSYTIEFTPSGQVVRIVDASKVRTAIKGGSPAARAGQTLVSDDVIKERHAIPALPGGSKKEFARGDSWSNNKSFNFGMMGAKSYEKVYELKDVEQSDESRVAVAEMNAVPSTQDAKELHKEQVSSSFTKMFDNIETYTGRLRLDLNTGKVLEYRENLKTEWLAVDPSYNADEQKRPNALRMAAQRMFLLERID